MLQTLVTLDFTVISIVGVTDVTADYLQILLATKLILNIYLLSTAVMQSVVAVVTKSAQVVSKFSAKNADKRSESMTPSTV